MKQVCYLFLIIVMFSNHLFGQTLDVTLAPISPDKVFLPTFTENTTVTVNGSVTNGGSIMTDSFKVLVYFSTDTIIDYSDQLIFDQKYTGLTAGQVQLFTTSLGLWRDMSLGQYHFIAVAYYLDSIPETIEVNNIAFAAFTIIPRAPDLTIAVYDLPVLSGLNLSLTSWEFNTGSAGAGVHTIGYFFSTDGIYDNKDKLITKISADPIPENSPGNFFNETFDLSYFIQDAGTYYIIVFADADSTVTELNENNNIAIVPFQISGDDLYIVNLSLDHQSVPPGSTLTTIGTGINKGDGDEIESFITAYYLSKDTVHSSSDYLLGSQTNYFISTESTFGLNKSLLIPSTVPNGNYYLIVYLDTANIVPEYNEANNAKAIPIRIGPNEADLAINSLSVLGGSALVPPGSNIQITGTGINKGDSNAKSFTIGYYLSTDSTYSSSDYLLASQSESLISPGNSFSLNNSLFIPSTVANGNYYIIASLDNANVVAEYSDANNTKAIAITIMPEEADLAINSLSILPEYALVSPGSTVVLGGSGVNSGNSSSKSFIIGYYLSTDSIYSLSDYFLGSQLEPSILVGSSFSLEKSLFIPSTIPLGNYYIIVRLDTANVVIELSKSNNFKAVEIKIDETDLAFVSLAVSAGQTLIPSGSTFTTIGSGINKGDILVNYFSTGYYLSQDSIYDSSDYLLGIQSDSSVSGGSIFALDKILRIPPTTPHGTYYLIVYLDITNSIAESDKLNNFVAIRIMIGIDGIDLTIGTLAASDSTAQPGTFIFITHTEVNLGELDATNHYIGYFLSKDSIYDPSDTYLSTNFLAGLNGYDSIMLNPALFIPISADTGKYYILVVADYGNKITEVNENNNTKALAMKFNYDYGGTANITYSAASVTASSSFYPNPTSGIIHFRNELVADEIDITNMEGRGLMNIKSISFAGTTLDLGQLDSGMYLVTTKKGGSSPTIQKLIVRK